MNKAVIHSIWLFCIGLVYFSVFLGGYDLWPPDEPRFAEVAREMMASGDYLVPKVNGAPYKEKPPLTPWLIAAFSYPAGEVTALTTRLPSLFAGVLALLLTYWLGKRLYGVRVAWWAALIFATTQRVWWQCHTGQIDMLLCAWLSLALLAYAGYAEGRRRGWLLLFYLACAGALYAKGPGVLVYPALFVLAYEWPAVWACRKGFSAWRKSPIPHMLLGFSGALLLYSCWLIPARIAAAAEVSGDAGAAIASNLFRQTIGRFLLGVSHANPPWYYLETLPVDWLPWTLFLPWIVLWAWRRRREDDRMRLLLAWIVPAFIFFSIAIGKRNVYLLPIFPACAILAARAILDLMEGEGLRWRKTIGILWAFLLMLIGLAPFALLLTPFRDQWHAPLLSLTVIGWGAALATGLSLKRNTGRNLHLVIASSFILLSSAAAFTALPLVNEHKSARAFCAPVRTLSEAGASFELHTAGFIREEYIFYSRHFVQEHFTDLLTIEAIAAWPEYRQVKVLERLRHRLAKAVNRVAIEQLSAIRPAEQAALRQAATKEVDLDDLSPELLAAFEAALGRELEALFGHLQGQTPAFLYIQEEDWRWIVALYPNALSLNVIHDRAVGSRHVVLLANEAGARLLAEQGR